MSVPNVANTGRVVMLTGIPIASFIPMAIFVLAPIWKMFFLGVAILGCIVSAVLSRRGYTLNMAIRRTRRSISGRWLPATPAWQRRGW